MSGKVEEPFDEFIIHLNVQMLKGKWDSSRLMDFLINRIGYEGGWVGGSVRPANTEKDELEFYESLRDDIAELILSHEWKGQETDEVDMVHLWHDGARLLAQMIVDQLTTDSLV